MDDTLRNVDTHLLIKQKDIIDFLYESGMKLAIASTNKFARFILYINDIDYKFVHIEQGKFDDEYSTDEEKTQYESGTKSHMYKNILDELNISPKNVLVIDDSFINVCMAKRMGMKAIQVTPNKLVSWQELKQGMSQFNTKKRRSMSCHF